MKTRLLAALMLSAALVLHAEAADSAYLDVSRPEVAAFIDDMVQKHEFSRDALTATLGKAQVRESIIEKISTPAEKKLTWGEYRKIFITPERIGAGATFWRENREMLERIHRETGVPVDMIVGIIGVETYFGRITGKDRVLDALVTLAFDYPRRAKFFRSELEHFLVLAREEGLDATEPLGSYAGAMGRPQFMPSSFRAYAVDATGDGKRDIWNNWADVAGSVANYFVEHGWRPGEEVVAQAATDLPLDSDGQLLAYEGDDGPEYWVGFHNFFVITRYNRSTMYALAAWQLGQQIASEVGSDEG
ncbi:MAG: lytic murein transglycosylase B [Woeseiaceae bacterium]